MINVLQFMGSLVTNLAAFALYQGLKWVYRESTSPMRVLPGPTESASLVLGNFGEIWDAESSVLLEKWIEKYGPTIRLTGLFGIRQWLYTTDMRALSHVLMNTDVYQNPGALRYFISRIMGPGLRPLLIVWFFI